MLDLIVLGLGPAGLALAHRAQARGFRVLGIDPNPEWEHTIGVWEDEIPAWLQVPELGRCRPKVRSNGFSRTIERDYVVVDPQTLRTRLTNFPVLRATATIIDAHTVFTDAGHHHEAKRVVDARGWPFITGPVQQAAGHLADDAEPWWMDVRGEHFIYSVPMRGRWLVETTLLITEQARPWEELETTEPCHERVLFPMQIPPYGGPALPFGVRAGMLSPLTGYSVATAWRYVDEVLAGNYPWRRPSWKIEQILVRRSQRLLLSEDHEHFFEEMFRLEDATLRRFLQLGDLRGTVVGMWTIFRRAPWLRRSCIRALLGR